MNVLQSKPRFFLKPFFVLLFLLGLAPGSSKSKIYKLYVLAGILSSVWWYSSSTRVWHSKLFESYPKMIKFTDEVVNFFLTGVTVAITVVVIFLQPKKFQSILDYLTTPKHTLDGKCMYSKRTFWVLFFAVNICFTLQITFECIVWINTIGISAYQYNIDRNVKLYQLNILLCVELWLCLELKSRFKYVNVKLKLASKQYRGGKLFNTMLQQGFIFETLKVKEIQKLKTIHNTLCNVLDSFNEVFGGLILLKVVFIISIIVHYTLLFVTYCGILANETSSIEDDLPFNIHIGVVGIIVIVNNVLKLITLAAVGEMVYNEGNKTMTICYGIINDLEIHNPPGYEITTSKLTSFIQQVGRRNPKVAASSCFDVRFSMIGFIVASITSYIIVAVQFMIQEK